MKKSSKTFKASDPSHNVYGFRVNTSGIKLEAFLENPVCLLNHNYDKVMGSWADILLVGKDLQGVPVFDTEDEEANKYYGQVERGVIKGASIGIIPLAVDGDEITSCELLEISITPVPANRNALVIYNAKGQKLNAKEAKAYMLSVATENTDNQNLNQNLKKMDKELIAALVLLCAQSGITVELSASSTAEDAVGVITKIGNKITALTLSNSQLKTANDTYKSAEDAARTKEGEDLVNLAVADKRITADQRDNFIRLHAADPALAKATLEGLKPVTLTAIPGAKDAAEKVTEGEDRSNWSFDDYATKDSIALSAMQTGEPEKFAKLFTDKVKSLRSTGAIAAGE